MPNFAKSCPGTIVHTLRYRDAHKAIDFLIAAFGFERRAVFEGPCNTVAHAELTFGNGMIMLGSLNDNEWGRHIAQPDEIGGRETAAAYLIVSDAAAVYHSAKAAGARIVSELNEPEYGGKAFSCADPEGHLWSIGEYDPWASST